MIDVLSSVLLLCGCAVVLLGSIGLLRFPDFLSRLHSAGTIDTLGVWLVMGALLLTAGSVVVGFKVLMIAGLLFFISPVVSHALAKSAMEDKVDPQMRDAETDK